MSALATCPVRSKSWRLGDRLTRGGRDACWKCVRWSRQSRRAIWKWSRTTYANSRIVPQTDLYKVFTSASTPFTPVLRGPNYNSAADRPDPLRVDFSNSPVFRVSNGRSCRRYCKGETNSFSQPAILSWFVQRSRRGGGHSDPMPGSESTPRSLRLVCGGNARPPSRHQGSLWAG